MASDIHKVIKLLIGSVLIGLLSGCSGMFGVGDAILMGSSVGSWGGASTPPPPEVLCTTEDSIGVGYSFEENSANKVAQHNEAMRLISEHCVGGYVETKRIDYFMSRTIYATCLQANGSPAVSQPCEYEEVIGFGLEDIETI